MIDIAWKCSSFTVRMPPLPIDRHGAPSAACAPSLRGRRHLGCPAPILPVVPDVPAHVLPFLLYCYTALHCIAVPKSPSQPNNLYRCCTAALYRRHASTSRPQLSAPAHSASPHTSCSPTAQTATQPTIAGTSVKPQQPLPAPQIQLTNRQQQQMQGVQVWQTRRQWWEIHWRWRSLCCRSRVLCLWPHPLRCGRLLLGRRTTPQVRLLSFCYHSGMSVFCCVHVPSVV